MIIMNKSLKFQMQNLQQRLRIQRKLLLEKKLAELNKKGKDALAREMKREANSEDSCESWLPELSFSTVLTVVGIGVTAIDLFFRFYTSKTEKDNSDLTPVHMVHVSPEPALSKKLVGVELEWLKRLFSNS